MSSFMKKLLLLLMFLSMFMMPLMASEQLDEVNSNFTYNGQPIHPFLIREFSNLFSDNRPPMVTIVDIIAAYGTNKYMQSDVKRKDAWWFAEEIEMDGDIRLYDSFHYHWLGKSANDVHALETGASGGGSGFFMDLIFVKFSEGEVFWEGKREKQLLMSIVGIYSLGDRYDGDIEVYSDTVFIPADKNQFRGGPIKEDVELEFPD